MADLVAGVDGCKRGWVAVVLIDGRFREARLLDGVESAFAELADVQTVLAALGREVAPGRIDRSRIGLLGHSRGGGAVLLAAARPPCPR